MLKPYNRVNTFFENTEIFQCEYQSGDFYNENLLFRHKNKAIHKNVYQTIFTFFQPARVHVQYGLELFVPTDFVTFNHERDYRTFIRSYCL